MIKTYTNRKIKTEQNLKVKTFWQTVKKLPPEYQQIKLYSRNDTVFVLGKVFLVGRIICQT